MFWIAPIWLSSPMIKKLTAQALEHREPVPKFYVDLGHLVDHQNAAPAASPAERLVDKALEGHGSLSEVVGA